MSWDPIICKLALLGSTALCTWLCFSFSLILDERTKEPASPNPTYSTDLSGFKYDSNSENEINPFLLESMALCRTSAFLLNKSAILLVINKKNSSRLTTNTAIDIKLGSHFYYVFPASTLKTLVRLFAMRTWLLNYHFIITYHFRMSSLHAMQKEWYFCTLWQLIVVSLRMQRPCFFSIPLCGTCQCTCHGCKLSWPICADKLGKFTSIIGTFDILLSSHIFCLCFYFLYLKVEWIWNELHITNLCGNCFFVHGLMSVRNWWN